MGMVVYTLEEDIPWRPDPELDVDHLPDSPGLSLDEFEAHYKKVSQLAKNDPSIAEAVRKNTVDLQAGEGWTKIIWKRACNITLDECLRLYNVLGVNLKAKDTCGESFYKDMLADVVKDLEEEGFAKKSDGAICVFPPGFKNKEGGDLPSW